MLTPPPFDAELAPVLAELFPEPPEPPDLDTLAVTQPRVAQSPPVVCELSDEHLARGGAFAVEHRQVAGPAGAPDVTVLVCRPAGVGPGAGAPGIVHVHGGGMVSGDRTTGMDLALDWATAVGAVVVAVEYRLAPTTPHPGPVEDCYAALLWTAEHTDELGIDPERLLVAGGSAGGGLVAALALLARDRGGPALRGQLLLCPMLDDRNDTVSARQMTGVDTWDSVANERGWTALLGDARGGPDVSPYAAPARAADAVGGLSGLPPAFLDVGSCETFRDEVVAYASALWRDGGQAELHVWPGGNHGFDVHAPRAAISRGAKAAREAWLRRVLSPRGT